MIYEEDDIVEILNLSGDQIQRLSIDKFKPSDLIGQRFYVARVYEDRTVALWNVAIGQVGYTFHVSQLMLYKKYSDEKTRT